MIDDDLTAGRLAPDDGQGRAVGSTWRILPSWLRSLLRPMRSNTGWFGGTERFRVLPGWLVLVLFCLPLLAGTAGTVLPAFDLSPVAGLDSNTPALTGWRTVLNDPRAAPSFVLTLFTGLIATVLVLGITLLTLISMHGTRWWHWLNAVLPPLLAVPHAAMAVGLAFLVAPSGWLVRLFSPWLTGWQRPPLDWVVPDGSGWSLIAGLVIKETPFLLLVAIAQLSALNVDASMHIGRTLGYAPARCWSRLILPLLYPRIRLSLFVILAFNLSVVDMALLLGPGNPPTFSVFLLSLVNDPGARAAASAGALLLAIGVLLVFLLVRLLEVLVAQLARRRRTSGKRGMALTRWRHAARGFIIGLFAFSLLSLIMLPLWSVAYRWRFPAALPDSWSLEQWRTRGDLLLEPMLSTLGFAVVVGIVALVAAVTWLESHRVANRHAACRAVYVNWLWYLPLLLPQVTLLFGWQAAALLVGADGKWWAVAYAHWVYCMPYVVLILTVAWRDSDPNWQHAAAVLGAGYWRTLWRVRLPLLGKPVCQALAVAMAVSVAQYLPTLLLGAGRHQTLAIELVTSFGGVDRRSIAALAVLQSFIPLLAFVAALAVPHWWLRARGKRA